MVAPRSPQPSRNVKEPVRPGVRVARQYSSRILFARGDGLVQQCPDFLASDAARPTGLLQSLSHFVCRCRKKFLFQGGEQRR